MTGNLLGHETSPYLLQHQHNPVHWQTWGPSALAQAQARNKPVLLSVGYAACHWCHVMAHESFEDPAIAAVMNDLFVCIKVDREERPDIDLIYQHALALLGQQGGWPLTMFLTPSGEPFWGGTYFPPRARWGRPGFVELLQAVAETFHAQPDKVARNVAALGEALTRMANPPQPAEEADAAMPGTGLTPELLEGIAQRLVREIDPLQGGFGEAPKFPQTAALGLLWRAWMRTGRQPYRQAVLTSLTALCQGGIYDHVGGGFSRYSVDAQWLVPHFEKMLYDNAQLLELLTLVWQSTGNPLYRVRIAETADWVLREMVTADGGFASTLDADSEGEEGRFYVWSAAQIDAALAGNAHAALFKQVYGVTEPGNFEGHTILNRLDHLEMLDGESEAALHSCRQTLFHVRAERVRPGWDDKVLADWNGLMITALARAGLALGRSDWLAAARTAFAFVVTQMMQPTGRLWHSARAGRLSTAGMLDDYAAMARAALALYEATAEPAYLAQAQSWDAIIATHFLDPRDGAYFLTADDADALIVRPRHANDAAMPSGAGQALEVLARLWLVTAEPAYRTRADALIAAMRPAIGSNFFPLATLINAAELLDSAVQLVIVGARHDANAAALFDHAVSAGLPHRLLLWRAPDADLAPGHVAADKGLVEGRPAAYLCLGTRCLPPITTPEGLKAALHALMPDAA
jgi:uncharacterized protein